MIPNMKRATRKSAPPAKTPVISLQASPALRRAIESWARRQSDNPVLPEAIRRLVELGLSISEPTTQTSAKAAAKASEMAGLRIDQLADPGVPEEERHARKRRLI